MGDWRSCKNCDPVLMPHLTACRYCDYDHSKWKKIPCQRCGGALSEIREHNGKRYRHCYSCHFEFFEEE